MATMGSGKSETGVAKYVFVFKAGKRLRIQAANCSSRIEMRPGF